MKCDRYIRAKKRAMHDAASKLRQIPSGTAAHRQRGTVLILVVALLGMLFVAGVTLLSTVTFSTKTLEAEKEKRDDQAVVDGIERYLSEMLGKGFLGDDGFPYNASTTGMVAPSGTDDPYTIAWPPYGEIPGMYLTVDYIEPLEDGQDGKCVIDVYSRFDRAADDLPGIQRVDDGTDPTVLSTVLLHNLDVTTGGFAIEVRDADGDGIPDGPQITVPSSMISAEARRILAARLRDPEYVQPEPEDEGDPPFPGPDTLYLTTKIVPHGSMVNVNARIVSDDSLWDPLAANILGFDPDSMIDTGQPYLPSSDEWALRNRGGVILPRSLDATRLMVDLLATGQSDSSLEAPLLKPQAHDDSASSKELLEDSSNRRWWQFDPDDLVVYNDSTWRKAMDPYAEAQPGARRTYDVAHVLTTVSHDDQLIRSGKADGGEQDLIESLMEDSDFRQYSSWDNYPDYLDDKSGTWVGDRDPRLGRLKLSLAYLDTNGLLPAGKTIDDVSTGGPVSTNGIRLVETIQDTFLLLLRNRRNTDFNLDQKIEDEDHEAIAFTAAALTANLIDFVDSDDNPTAVPVRDFDGKVWTEGGTHGLTAYGLERQPYITELYARPRKVPISHFGCSSCLSNKSNFGVEIYNPYDVAISMEGYRLVDLGPKGSTRFTFDDGTPTGKSFKRMEYELSGMLPGNTFGVLGGFGEIPGHEDFDVYWEDASTSGFVLDDQSIIALVRNVDGVDVVVDKINVDQALKDNWITVEDDEDSVFGVALDSESSIQRDTTADAWRFVVPRAVELEGGGKETLGKPNGGGAENTDIRTVHIDFNNSGKFTHAFPTTGSLLLLMRHAHQTKDGADGVPFNHIYDGLMAREYEEIDNGRMPVFDLAGNHHKAPSNKKGDIQGIEALPWGQLVFDYFTALPLNSNDQSTIYQQMRPKVSEEGLKVTGRININTAPWSVMSGLPYVPTNRGPIDDNEISRNEVLRKIFPDSSKLQKKLLESVFPANTGTYPPAQRFYDNTSPITPSAASEPPQPTAIGMELAQSIAHYREDRLEEYQRNPMYEGDAAYRRGYGFLTVGELLNVRDVGDTEDAEWKYTIDNGAVQANKAGTKPIENDYIKAIGKMVALSDWVTTKSHVFTIYGTLRGQHKVDLDLTDNDELEEYEESIKEVDSRAIRFQVTVDRLPMLLGEERPVTIGSSVVEQYLDVRSD